MDYFCVKLYFNSLTLRNVRRAQADPAALTVKIRLEVGAFSLICGISRELMVWFLPLFYHDKCIILWLGFFPFNILMFFLLIIL